MGEGEGEGWVDGNKEESEIRGEAGEEQIS